MIETPRLLLRPYSLGDYDAYVALTADPAVVPLFGNQPMSREDAWNRLLRYAGHWALFGYGLFAVFERESGRHLGETGLADFHRGLGPSFDPDPEAAWVFAGAHHGQGYAGEAAAAAHRWFAETHGAARTVCIIRPDNASSLRVAEKLGYRRFGSTIYRDVPFEMMERAKGS